MTGGQPRDGDTICAIATNPNGCSAIAVIRVSGGRAVEIVRGLLNNGHRRLQPMQRNRYVSRVVFQSDDDQPLDDVLVVAMRGPKSYTGEDVVEIHCHGGVVPQHRIIENLCRRGCRLAEPGEFTRRAVLNGKLSLLQAEAIRTMIEAISPVGASSALHELLGQTTRLITHVRQRLVAVKAAIEADLDFPDEDPAIGERDIGRELLLIDGELAHLEGTFENERLYRQGVLTIFRGDVNVGKSSLFNRLLGCERAIVTVQPGTTRDILEETITLGPWAFRIVDAAGFRASDCPIECEGIRRAEQAAERADIVIDVVDVRDLIEGVSTPLRYPYERCLRVANKSDLVPPTVRTTTIAADVIVVSALTGEGIDRLTKRMCECADERAGSCAGRNTPRLTSIRQRDGVRKAREALANAVHTVDHGQRDLVATEVGEAVRHLAVIIGDVPDEEVLKEIFATFCLGK